MIDLIEAKKLVVAQIARDKRVDESRVLILDHEIQNHDWGWVIVWDLAEKTKREARAIRYPYLFDRSKGTCISVAQSGIFSAVYRIFRRGKTETSFPVSAMGHESNQFATTSNYS